MRAAIVLSLLTRSPRYIFHAVGLVFETSENKQKIAEAVDIDGYFRSKAK